MPLRHINSIHKQLLGPRAYSFVGASVQTGPKTRVMEAICRDEIKYHLSRPRRPNKPSRTGDTRAQEKMGSSDAKEKVPLRL